MPFLETLTLYIAQSHFLIEILEDCMTVPVLQENWSLQSFSLQ